MQPPRDRRASQQPGQQQVPQQVSPWWERSREVVGVEGLGNVDRLTGFGVAWGATNMPEGEGLESEKVQENRPRPAREFTFGFGLWYNDFFVRGSSTSGRIDWGAKVRLPCAMQP